MPQPPRLIRDGFERDKLKVSLPGGRYQLSLNDRAVNLLRDDLGLETRDTVSEAFVPFFVALGDAWFPNEKDTRRIIEDLRGQSYLTENQRQVLLDYVTQSNVPEANVPDVLAAIEQSPLEDEVDADDLTIQPLPEIPAWSSLGADETNDDTASPSSTETPDEEAETDQRSEAVVGAIEQIRGIGEIRAQKLADGGFTSITDLAEARPVEVSQIDGISHDIAVVAIEGARERLGQKEPAASRLATETGEPASTFEPVLNSLAASGIPSTEAEATLRILYGPTVAEIEGISGREAYFLWEAGYRTPRDIAEASVAELTEVYQIGEIRAPQLQDRATELLST